MAVRIFALSIGGALGACHRTEAAPTAAASAAGAERVIPSGAPPLAASAPSAGAGEASAFNPCEKLCAHSRELGCSTASECPAACREMLTEPTCADALRAALRCFVAQPPNHFECGDDGIAVVKDGVCDGEQARYVECVGKATAAAP